MNFRDSTRSICQETDKRLWQAYDNRDTPAKKGDIYIGFRFPQKSDGTIRMSEQEARLAAVESILHTKMQYSIETPTMERYCFTGTTHQSASTDLTIYDLESTQKCNVEFKAGGRSPNAIDHLPIRKDFEKLLRESPSGLWFHLLKSVNKSTLPNLLHVMANQIFSILEKEDNERINTPSLTIHISVLNHQFSIEKTISVQKLLSMSNDQIIALLEIGLVVSREQIAEELNLNGWLLFINEDA